MQAVSINHLASFWGHTEPVYTLQWGDYPYFYSAGGDKRLVKWNIQDEQTAQAIALADAGIYTLKSFESSLLIGTNTGGLTLINHKINQQLFNIQLPYGIFCCEVNEHNQCVYVGLNQGYLAKIHLVTGKLLDIKKIAKNHIRSMVQSKNALWLAASDGWVYQLGLENFDLLHSQHVHNDSVFSIALHNSNLFTGSKDAHLKKWILTNEGLEEFNAVLAHLFTINQILILENQNLLITAGRDKCIKFWDLETLSIIKVLSKEKDSNMHSHSVNCLAYYADKQILLSAGDDRGIRAWQLSF